MISRRSLCFALLGVILWNAVLSGAGVIIVCTHDAEETHFVDQSDDCHTKDDKKNAGDCDDLELSGIDLLTSVRDDSFDLSCAPMIVEPVAALQMPWKSLASRGTYMTRGPPSESTSVLIARTVVLRL